MSSKDNLALDLEHGVRRWDRARWISVFSSHNPTIREVTECLGLGLSASSSTTNRGIPKFDNPDYRKLSSEVTKLSKELPKERDALLDFAADPQSLDHELEELLGTYGPAIWSKDADRTCLLTPDPNKKTYNKHLYYEEQEHKDILKVHLHRWIIIKACYYIRNMKLKRPSGANDYDTLADIDGESQLSPHGTPHALTPPEHDATPGNELDVKPVNGKKRKSDAFGALSDGEERSATPNKRPYSTMPLNRRSKSPRKSLHSLLPGGHGSMENVPPLPSQKHHLSPSPANGVEPVRSQLSPLSSNDVNGIARPSSTTPAPAVGGGFTAVNTGGFTAVNNTPPVRAPSRDTERTSSREPQHASPPQPQHDARKYTSPYDPISHDTHGAKTVSTPVPAAPTASAPNAIPSGAQGYQSLNPSADRLSHNHRGSPAPPAAHHAHIAPQPQPHGQAPNSHAAHERSHSLLQSQQPQVFAQPAPFTAERAAAERAQQVHARGPPHSRGSSPSNHFTGRSLAPHPTSRSNTPHAPVASNQPPPASNAPIAPAPPPAVQTAHAYGISLVPTQPQVTPPTSSVHPSQPQPQQHLVAPPPQQQQQQPPPPPRHPQTVLKSQPVETVPAPALPPRAAVVPTAELRVLQCDVTTSLLQWLFPKTAMPQDEQSLLHRINTLWYHGEPIFRPELGAHYDLVSHVLTSWLQERYAISSLQHALAAQPGAPSSSSALVDRILAMNDLRAMRLKWKNMSPVDGMSPEDLLVRSFCVMTMTEGTEFMFKEGLNRLERTVFEFLRSEDAKIVLHRR
ncbi:hypothetical protein FB567DRAFT_441158 [Paraphoma chrysanthemicola]|uniref:Uncharacterized protein n=1 Tax=Paraphoma chrysanthemicola TaxID=798071 RepID=A0A8K0R6H6_9PLEO|nr:hypothetical protein FB567DRAFT_441158 [Paraphoma chrysanthemicola]